MRWLSWLALALAALGSGVPVARAAKAPDAGAYAVTYFDVIPADISKASALLRQFVKATRRADGNVEFTLLGEIGRPGRMATLEGWRDKAALEAHHAAVETLAGALQPMLAAPFDTRQFVPLSTGPRGDDAKPGSVHVLTHIDVFPNLKDEATTLVKGAVDASRKEKGVERFDAVVWDGHPNHFELIETWANDQARQAHVDGDQTRTFRARLVPLEGGLYDQRLYKVVE